MGRLNRYKVEAIPMRANGFCGIAGCTRQAKAKGHCIFHYDRVKEYGAAGSALPVVKKGRGLPCEVVGCKRKVQGDGLCQMHYRRRTVHGATGAPEPEKRAKGEGSINATGYMKIKVGGRSYFEHRYVMEQHLRRPLFKGENVHHRDGNRLNNEITNLEIWNTQQPSGQRVEDKIRWAIDMIDQYPQAAQEELNRRASKKAALASIDEDTTVSDFIRGVSGLI